MLSLLLLLLHSLLRMLVLVWVLGLGATPALVLLTPPVCSSAYATCST
jgi:hypothetical protein